VKKLKHDMGMRIAQLTNLVLLTIPFAACWYAYYGERILTPFYRKGNWIIIAIFVVLYCVFARIYDAFTVPTSSSSELVYSQCLSVLLADCVMFLVIWVLTRFFPAVWPGLLALLAQVALALLWSYLVRRWYFHVFPPEKTAVVFDQRDDVSELLTQYGLDKKYDIQKVVTIEDCLADMRVFHGLDTVFICGVQSHERNIVLKNCIDNDIQAYILPRIGDVLMSGAKPVHILHLPVLHVQRCRLHPEGLLLKRLFDIVSSGLVLLVVSPIMLVTAIAIKATDGGPVFYKQRRLTKDGREFNVLKFRSMRVDAEKDGVARLSTGDKDDRITPVGRIIRKVRIDELPQLLNILGGSMSVVGPRPERPEIAAQYEETLPEFRLRLQVKAGLTGYAQVYGKYNTTPYDKLQMDLMYIANPSFWEDLRIIFATVKILFKPESTEGVAEGQTTATREKEEKELLNV